MKNNMFNNPVFIIGVPRSGTSMLWNILIRLDAFKGIGKIEWNTETSIFKKYVRYMHLFFVPGKWPFWYEYYGGSKKYFEEFIFDSCRSFLVNAAKARKAKRILEKTPNHIEHIDFIVKIFSEAKFIHIYRHPVDIYTSMRKRAKITESDKDPWLRVSIEEFAESYIRKINLALFSRHRIMHVKYEDLTKEAEAVVKRICTFIQEKYDPSSISGSLPIKRVDKFPLCSNVPIYNSKNWEGTLQKHEVIKLEKLCAGILHRLKYDKYLKEVADENKF